MKFESYNTIVVFVAAISLSFVFASSPNHNISSTSNGFLKSDDSSFHSRKSLDLSFVSGGDQNNLLTVIDNLASAAHVFSAISLQLGLADGSIRVDKAIAELMNVGDLDLKSLDNFDKTKVDNFADQLKSTKTVGNGKLEQSLSKLYAIKEIGSSEVDLTKLPDSETYKKLSEIKKIGVPGTSLKPESLDQVLTLLSKSELNDADVETLKTPLNTILSETEKLKTSVNLEEQIGILTTLKPLQVMSKLFDLLDTPLKFKDPKSSETVDQALANLGVLTTLAASAESSAFGAVSTLVSSRFIYHPTDRVYTSGFVEGFKDLEKLTKDADSKWLRTVTGSVGNYTSITKLADLTPSMTALDQAWNKISTVNVYESIQEISNFHTSLVSIGDTPSKKELETVLAAGEGCIKDFKTDNEVNNKVGKIAVNADVLLRKVLALNRILQSRAELVADVGKLAATNSPDDVRMLKNKVAQLQSDLKMLLAGEPFDKIEMDTEDSEYITDFNTDGAVALYLGAVDCIKNLKGVEKVCLAARLTTQIGDIGKKSGLIDNVKSATEAVASSVQLLVDIRTAVNQLTVDSKKMVKNLTPLKDLQKHSQPFGTAVNALVSVKKILEKSMILEEFITKGNSLEDDVKSTRQEKMEKEFKKHWGNFGDTSEQIRTLVQGIKDWMSGHNASAHSSLLETSGIFKGLSDLPDVDLNTKNRLAALNGELMAAYTSLKTSKDDFKKSLMDISQMDLQFSRFKTAVESMPQTLEFVAGIFSAGKNGTNINGKMPEPSAQGEGVALAVYGVFGVLLVLFMILASCNIWKSMKETKLRRESLGDVEKGNKKKGNKKNNTSSSMTSTSAMSSTTATEGDFSQVKNSKNKKSKKNKKTKK